MDKNGRNAGLRPGEGRKQVTGTQSLYLRAMRERAEASDRSLVQLVAEDRENAATPRGLTDDCLLPDEAQDLLRLENVTVTADAIDVRGGGHSLTMAQQALVQHVSGCTFCRGMLGIMKPSADARERLLAEVRKSRDEAAGVSPAADPTGPFAPAFRRVAAAWPLAIPALVLALPLLASVIAPTVVSEAVQASKVSMIAVSVVAGVVAYVVVGMVHAGALRPFARMAARVSSTVPMATAALVAAVIVAIYGGAEAIRMDRAIFQAQKIMAVSANNAFGGDPRKFTVIGSNRALDVRPLTQTPLFATYAGRDDRFVGEVVAEVGRDHAEIAWLVQGSKLRPIRLQLEPMQDASAHRRAESAPAEGAIESGRKAIVTVTYTRPLLSIQRLELEQEDAKFPFLRTAKQ